MPLTNIFDKGEPDFINELGIKWWHYPSAERQSLPLVKAFYIEFPKNENTKYIEKQYILVTEKEGVIYETQSLEALGIRLDVLQAGLLSTNSKYVKKKKGT